MIKTMAIYGTLPGALGGIVLFVYGYKKGHYRNNKYKIKLSIEVVGAAITATMLALLFPDDYRIVAAFLIGLSWSGIIQMVRKKITATVSAALGEKFE